MNEIYQKSILIIGGMGIGKTTVSKLISNRLNLPVISTDAYKDEFLNGIEEYSFEKELEIRENYGFKKEAEYLIPFLNMSFNNLIDNLKEPTIIDVSGLDTFKISDELIEKILNFKNIILLSTENVEELVKRRGFDLNSEIGELYLDTSKNPINFKIAKKIINIQNKTPENITNEIINSLSKKL